MYIKNSNFVIFIALAAIVGFGLSLLFSGLNLQNGFAGGDIAKAVRFNNQKEDPALTVIEERLRNDEEFFNNTKNAMKFLEGRMAVLSELTEQTVEACEGKPEFESLMSGMKSLNAKSYNTMMAMTNAGEGLAKLAEGKSAPEYEIYSNQAYIGFGNVESQMDLGREFQKSAASYLKGKEDKQIAGLSAIWKIYSTQDLYLNSSEGDLVMLSQDNHDTKDDTTHLEDDMARKIFDSSLKIKPGNRNLGQYVNEIATVCEDLNAVWLLKNGDVDIKLNDVAGMQLNKTIADFKLNDAVIGTQLNSVQTMMKAAFPNMDLNWAIILQSNRKYVRNTEVLKR